MKKYLYTLIAFLALGVVGFAGVVTANPSRVQEPASCSTQGVAATSLSTTSLTYMSGGAATTTITCNMGIAGDGTQVWDSAKLAIQLTGSSSPLTILKWRYEFSNGSNCGLAPTGCDWYAESIDLGGVATTSVEVREFREYSWTFSSTTNQGGVAGNVGRALKYVDVPVAAKYVRVIFYLTPTSHPGALWANLVGKVERLN